MAKYNVLVTSVGGDLGKAVCKSLQHSVYPINILGTDCKEYVPYPLFCDSFKIIPRADSINYIYYLNHLISENYIDLVYICSEEELLYICDHYDDLCLEVRKHLAIPRTDIINICRNKYKTMEFLKRNYFPYPYSVLYNNSVPIDNLLKDFKYPLIIKKVSDCGSKHLKVIKNIKDFNDLPYLDSTYIIQEYIPGTEYTNAVYKDIFSNKFYVITLERTLKDGMSNEVKVVFDEEIESLCIEVAKKLDINGSINIQLRKEKGAAPKIFEINPRYSSTSFMRANFGFNDVIYAFENIVLKKSIDSPKINPGEAYRYITEYYKFYEGKCSM